MTRYLFLLVFSLLAITARAQDDTQLSPAAIQAQLATGKSYAVAEFYPTAPGQPSFLSQLSFAKAGSGDQLTASLVLDGRQLQGLATLTPDTQHNHLAKMTVVDAYGTTLSAFYVKMFDDKQLVVKVLDIPGYGPFPQNEEPVYYFNTGN